LIESSNSMVMTQVNWRGSLPPVSHQYLSPGFADSEVFYPSLLVADLNDGF